MTTRSLLRYLHRLDETEAVQGLLPKAQLEDGERHKAEYQARAWIEAIRRERPRIGGVSDFLQEFRLSSQEGVALMCLAEALLRIPDSGTADEFIRDKLAGIDWSEHDRRANTLFANASVWGLTLTGSLLEQQESAGLWGALKGLVGRVGQPVIRSAMQRAMGLLGGQFVLGRTIGEALDNAAENERKGYRHSYDMLGEGARTERDAARYFAAYESAIAALGARHEARGEVWEAPGLSVKLSALHPRFSESQREKCVPALIEKLAHLCDRAAAAGIPLTVDAEESERLELTLDIIETVLQGRAVQHWNGLGLAVQAYQKRAPAVIDLLENLCRTTGRHMMIRLVKGAYWDSEIKRSQMSGFADYPVYTRKLATDVSYLACARQLLESSHIYPSFGSHNAWTLSSILALAKPGQAFEVQRLHGMGIELHDQIVAAGIPSRIYAPVGGHQDLLAYLVRRILENGANSSFVYRLRDPHVPIASLVHDPVVELSDFTSKRNPAIPLPPDLFKPARRNSAGVDIDSRPVREQLLAELAKQPVSVGTVAEVTAQEVDHALDLAVKAQSGWAGQSVESRVRCLERVADLFEQNRAEFVALIGREAGRIIKNALAEVREAVDLCRYYAALARHDLFPTTLPGYTGETNSLRLVPRGCVAAISPWNFPLAIFAGQVAAALVSGNVVMAKPAEQTPYIAKRAVQLFHEAGVPKEVLVFLPGRGETVGAQLVSDPRIGAVVFTGSTEVGRLINQSLAHRPGPLVPIIAETGGLNAMIADSTALPEQVADDVILSAFDSAGQRCSSLRVLFVQEDVADKMTDMIAGAMAELRLGDPLCLETDIGPVIDSSAKETLEAHIMRMKVEGELLYATPLPESCENGLFVAPHLFEIPDMNILKREAFGPVLHVVRWQKDRLDTVVGSIAASGYGLTCGIHSRSEGFVRQLVARLPVGNLYVNRNMIGAIPGVQPFGGEGLSGTGPKAGGPHYLRRFCTERCVTRDTTAAGGNASLLMLEE